MRLKSINSLFCVCVLSILIIVPLNTNADQWDYNGQDAWPGKCSSGKMQSPIDLSKSIATVEKHMPALNFEKILSNPKIRIKNNGHAVAFTFVNLLQQPVVYNGGLSQIYITDNWHFHWKSEHTIDGNRFPLELHIVNYLRQYDNVSRALQYDDGVAVVGILFEESSNDNDELEPLVQTINTISKVDDFREIDFNITAILGPKANFYRYIGSLTTPPCTENIIWTVLANPLQISSNQLAAFKKILGSDGNTLVENYRVPQKLNERKVLLVNGATPQSSLFIVISSLLCLKLFFVRSI